ncbi:substrate-binding domain-containing protein [Paracidobacterium acidisoli]|uniref:Sugar ABC transporter substrate-binding protein n=1 Tax=Paracidobacterium acidisoli TaxID=2303751 RepID=A0A372IQ16_9BACT|nr:substrate-binding domain-containing protein [Paracidobacterium acidisoli]MBT9331412.1 substrate-binding domain-containing protein [Paracidobacterium acidisoli]
MRRVEEVLLIPAVAMLAMLSGCGGQRHARSEVYYLISNHMSLPYWQSAVEGFNKAAAQYGVTAQVKGPDNFDSQAELDALKAAIQAKPAGILISVTDAVAQGAQIDAALDAGIPVITMDSDAPSSHRLYFIGTNNLEAGRLGGQRVAQKLNGKGNVVFFTIAGQPNLEERLKGYRDAFATHPDIKIVDVFDTQGDSTKAFDQAQQDMAKTGAQKVDAFVCLEAAGGKDVGEVLHRSNATDRELVAMDVDPDTLSLVKSGVIDATIAQKPWTMGYIGLKALDEIHHDPPPMLNHGWSLDTFSRYPVFVDTGTALVDKTNVDLYTSRAAAAK